MSGLSFQVSSARFVGRVVLGLLIAEVLIIAADLILVWGDLLPGDHLQKIFNCTREESLCNWFSTILTVLLAVASFLIHIVEKGNGRSRRALDWLIFACFFLYISADDGATIHERVGSTAEDYVESLKKAAPIEKSTLLAKLFTNFPSYYWHIFFVPIFAIMFACLFFLLWQEMTKRQERYWILLAFSLLGLSQLMDFYEGIEDKHHFLQQALGLGEYTVLHFLKITEEFMEMLADTLLIGVLLKLLLRNEVKIEFTDRS